MKLLIIIAIASSLLAAEPSSLPVAKPGPPINTAKFWRLVAQAQSARQQASQTPQAKAAEAAEEALKKEQEELAKACGSEFILGYEQDTKSPNYQDVVCLPKPKPEKAERPESKPSPPPKGK